MLERLEEAESYARPAVSGYRVGAVVRGTSGALYVGANIEFPGVNLSQTVHAEQAALSNAFMHDEPGIEAIAVSAVPCGHCRQFLFEFAGGRDIEILVHGQPGITLSGLLPRPFGPRDLNVTGGPLSRTKIAMENVESVAQAARYAAANAYAPYTNSPSGVAIRSGRGNIYRGSYIENSAFNPSLPPLQAALAAMALANEDFREIAEVVLSEASNNSISQLSATKSLVAVIAPRAEFRLLPRAK
ncbi:MAG TPA: cytidine deaminase [Bryobacteraceae bacterium]|jgi:cytidine deaminase|nr:cytidine deaminase [Bryobacteraceae bacterium]